MATTPLVRPLLPAGTVMRVVPVVSPPDPTPTPTPDPINILPLPGGSCGVRTTTGGEDLNNPTPNGVVGGGLSSCSVMSCHAMSCHAMSCEKMGDNVVRV